jgi:hypothetical protein
LFRRTKAHPFVTAWLPLRYRLAAGDGSLPLASKVRRQGGLSPSTHSTLLIFSRRGALSEFFKFFDFRVGVLSEFFKIL